MIELNVVNECWEASGRPQAPLSAIVILYTTFDWLNFDPASC